MANTVNGVTAITASSQRETTGSDASCFKNPHLGEVLRARLVLDTAADFTVDSPIVDTGSTGGKRIYVVGLQLQTANANVVTLKSKVGASAAVQLEEYNLAANGGILSPVNQQNFLTVTDVSGVLIINASAAVDVIVYYTIADGHKPRGY